MCLILTGDYRQIQPVIPMGSTAHSSMNADKFPLEIRQCLRTYGNNENWSRPIHPASKQVASGPDAVHIVSSVDIAIADNPDDIKSGPKVNLPPSFVERYLH